MPTMSKALSWLMVLLVLVGMALFLLLASAVAANGSPPAGDAAAAAPAHYRVQPGDTLWAIAGEVAEPDADLRRVVHDIRRLNDLSGSLIRPGQVLVIPSR